MAWSSSLTRFLRRFAITLLGFSLKARLNPREVLSRFLPRRDWYKDGVVLPDAFMPRRGETSMYRLGGVSTWRIMSLGRLVTSAFTNGALHGRAYLVAEDVLAVDGLRLKAERLSLHAGIQGWPEKPRAKYLAMLLSDKARLEIYMR